jgi:hypothetical protein
MRPFAAAEQSAESKSAICRRAFDLGANRPPNFNYEYNPFEER